MWFCLTGIKALKFINVPNTHFFELIYKTQCSLSLLIFFLNYNYIFKILKAIKNISQYFIIATIIANTFHFRKTLKIKRHIFPLSQISWKIANES